MGKTPDICDPLPGYSTTEEIAKLLQVHRAAIYRIVTEHDIKIYSFGGSFAIPVKSIPEIKRWLRKYRNG